MESEDVENLKARGEFTVQMRQILIGQEDKQVKELINFSLALMSIFGLIAGFGFTAFQYIKFQSLFFLGEIVIIGAVFYLGLTVKHLLVGWAVGTSNEVYNYEAEAAEIKTAWNSKDTDKMKKMGKEFVDQAASPTTSPRVIRANIIDIHLNRSIWAALIGVVFILISFVSLGARDASWHQHNLNQT